MTYIDLSGRRIGRLVVHYREEPAPPLSRRVRWFCVCDCGNSGFFLGITLRRTDGTRSCGCIGKEKTAARNIKHGLARSLEHRIWCGIKTRCFNAAHKSYANYGGRGIGMDPAWADSFLAFFSDMGPAPSPTHSIERRNNDLGYTPDNCYWLEKAHQSRNRRNIVYLTHEGVTKSLRDWAIDTGIHAATIRSRIEQLGWPTSLALTAKLHRRSAGS